MDLHSKSCNQDAALKRESRFLIFKKGFSISLFVIRCFLRVLKASLARFIALFALIRHARLLIPSRPLCRIYASLQATRTAGYSEFSVL